MEQQNINDKVIRNENAISEIRGKWDSLATKEFVRETVEKQTAVLNSRFDRLEESISKEQSWRNKAAGAGLVIILILSTIGTFVPVLKEWERAKLASQKPAPRPSTRPPADIATSHIVKRVSTSKPPVWARGGLCRRDPQK